MKITFDAKKRQATLDERGLDFADADLVFDGLTLTAEDTRKPYGEKRLQTVGFLENRMVMIVWTPREEGRHVISMRKCNAKEQKVYRKRFEKG
jgi:uncharacterized DUF497 family protein